GKGMIRLPAEALMRVGDIGVVDRIGVSEDIKNLVAQVRQFQRQAGGLADVTTVDVLPVAFGGGAAVLVRGQILIGDVGGAKDRAAGPFVQVKLAGDQLLAGLAQAVGVGV